MKKDCVVFWIAVTLYTLGIHEGKIALWKDGDPTPETFPYFAEYLPEEDFQRLTQGIPIDSPQDLAQILEDYLS